MGVGGVMLTGLMVSVAQIAADPLFDQLAKVKFINSGIVKATDDFVWGTTWDGRDPTSSAANKQAGYVLYLEKYNISDGSWGAGGDGFPYLWKKKGAADSGGNDAPLNAPPSTCTSEPPTHNMDTTGATVSNHENVASWEDCRSLCCSDPTCGVYTYVNGSHAGNYRTCYLRDTMSKVAPSSDCVATNPTYDCYSGAKTCTDIPPTHQMDTVGTGVGGQGNVSSWEDCRALCCANPACGVYTYVNGSKAPNYMMCYLRDLQSHVEPSGSCSSALYDCFSGARPGITPPAPPPPPVPLDNIEDPPSGMRSAVPLGGISCGAVELRGDGSLREWTIMNQSPGGSGKIQVFPDAYFAVKVDTANPVAIQTHPLTPGLTGVSELNYSGSYPVSKLSLKAADVGGIETDLFAYSTYKINDMEASARPMASFSLAVTTPTATPSDVDNGHTVSFLMNLPTAIEPNMIRRGTPLGVPITAADSAACLVACNANTACLSWNFNVVLQACTLQTDAPNVFYAAGNDCGLRGAWTFDKVSQCLTLSRPGAGGSNGDMSMCASASGGTGVGVSFGTYDVGSGAFTDMYQSQLNGNTTGAHGAVVVTTQVPTASSATLTISFGWHFPARDHFGKILGNFYKNVFADSADAAFGTVIPTARGTALAGVVNDILAMQAPFHQSSLDPWLQDHLVNSLSHIRTAMWFDTCPNCHTSNDTRTSGYWRQWEAFDCPDLDSIHNDGERHLPYILFWPNSTRNKLAAWAGNQQPNGMLAEQIHNADPDQPEGRVMADSTSMFICYILELLRWSGDAVSLKLYYPTVRRAAEWQMNVSADFGVPLGLETTYDILGFTKYQLSTYSSAFHIMAMRAAAVLATAAGETEDAVRFSSAAERAKTSMDTLQWVNTSMWAEQPNTYCPEDFEYLGDGFTVAECVANCTGSCFNVFMSAVGNGCYRCKSLAVLTNSSGYTLYNRTGTVAGSWAAASDACTDTVACKSQHGFFSDALYGQVLAYSVGLGTVVSSESKIKSHLEAELAANCFHADGGSAVGGEGGDPGHLSAGCDAAGMVILTGRPAPGVTDWMIWEGAAPNHATLAIRTGEAPSTALDNFHKSATSWSERINDQWNTAGIKDTDGYPTVTSHYGFHMVSWHIPLAVSGQLADLSNPANKSLTFDPTISGPYTLPLMLPGVLGTVASSGAGKYSVSLTVGELELDVLSVDGVHAPGGLVHLTPGTPVSWSV